MKAGQYVLVTTSYRGVFAGEFQKQTGDKVTLRNARNCIYWSSDTGGFLGLVSKGPMSSCRIGDTAPSIELHGITSIAECSAASIKAWKKAEIYTG